VCIGQSYIDHLSKIKKGRFILTEICFYWLVLILGLFSDDSLSVFSYLTICIIEFLLDFLLPNACNSYSITYCKHQIIQAHPELKYYIGMDVDPVAHEKARTRIDGILHGDSCHPTSDLKSHTILKNFRSIKSVLSEVDEKILDTGVDGILMDLGMSSMQVCFLLHFLVSLPYMTFILCMCQSSLHVSHQILFFLSSFSFMTCSYIMGLGQWT